jgi:hypothetical protein
LEADIDPLRSFDGTLDQGSLGASCERLFASPELAALSVGVASAASSSVIVCRGVGTALGGFE